MSIRPLTSVEHVFNALLTLGLPHTCVHCHQPGTDWLPFLCQDCVERLPWDGDAGAQFSLFLYVGVARRLIKSLKYEHHRALVHPLGGWLAQGLPEHWLEQTIQAIVPVPLHPVRLREKEWNPAQSLAEVVGATLNIPVRPELLRKAVWTPTQTRLRRAQRQQNAHGSFDSSPSHQPIDNVLLIDDVITTGATVDACTRALKRNGIKNVWVATLARRP